MKECTLQEAVELCEKNGGCFYGPADFKWVLSDTGCILNEDGATDFTLTAMDFKRKFRYEPPKKSVFQEWEEEQVHILDDTKNRELRKEGFNFALDYLIKSNIGISQQVKQEIEKLKEK